MAEKLTIVLTDRDVEILPSTNGKTEIIEFSSKCPLCSDPLSLTQISGHRCKCGIAWGVDVKIKGIRTYTDEDNQQISIPFVTTA